MIQFDPSYLSINRWYEVSFIYLSKRLMHTTAGFCAGRESMEHFISLMQYIHLGDPFCRKTDVLGLNCSFHCCPITFRSTTSVQALHNLRLSSYSAGEEQWTSVIIVSVFSAWGGRIRRMTEATGAVRETKCLVIFTLFV